MIFLPLALISIGIIFGYLILMGLADDGGLFLKFLDSYKVKGLAIWLMTMNICSILLLLLLSVYVPRPKVIWFNLIFVWVTLLFSVIAGQVYIVLSDGDTKLIIGSPNDIRIVVGILVVAAIFCSWRIEVLNKTNL